MNRPSLVIRRWFDRIYGNSYASWRCTMPNGAFIVGPMQYGSGSQPEFDALRELGLQRGLVDITDEGYMLKRRMFVRSFEWTEIPASERQCPKSHKWAPGDRYPWRVSGAGYGDTTPFKTLTEARKFAAGKVCDIYRRAESVESIRFVLWAYSVEVTA